MRRRCCCRGCTGMAAFWTAEEGPPEDGCSFQFTDMSNPSEGHTINDWNWTFYETSDASGAIAGTSSDQNTYFQWETLGTHAVRLVVRDTNNCVSEYLAAVVCDSTATPWCSEFPVYWLAIIGNMPTKPNGSRGTFNDFGAFSAPNDPRTINDPHNRIFCEDPTPGGGAEQVVYWSRFDWSPLNGVYEIPDAGQGTGWAMAVDPITGSNFPVAIPVEYGFEHEFPPFPSVVNETTIEIDHYSDDNWDPDENPGHYQLRFRIRAFPCHPSNGNVTVEAVMDLYRQDPGPTAEDFIGRVMSWRKDVAVGGTPSNPGHLKDMGPITMDHAAGDVGGFRLWQLAVNYVLKDECNFFSLPHPAAPDLELDTDQENPEISLPTLILVPNG